MKHGQKINRGAKRVRRAGSVFVGVWVPSPVVVAIDHAVETLDLDRSKFLRRAIEEKISKEAA
jgi:hypothetical protein